MNPRRSRLPFRHSTPRELTARKVYRCQFKLHGPNTRRIEPGDRYVRVGYRRETAHVGADEPSGAKSTRWESIHVCMACARSLELVS